MIFLQGLARGSGASGACLKLASSGTVRLYVSPPIIAEVRNVLNRPKVRRKFPSLTDEFVETALQALLEHSELVQEVPHPIEYPRDPKDEPYLNLALAADVEYLVTADKDLLDLMDPSTREGRAFQGQFSRLLILEPAALLQLLGR
jgi:uncharacterized protein